MTNDLRGIPADRMCPWCGGIVKFRDESDNETESWFIYCPKCKLEFGGLPEKDEMVSFWNIYVKCAKEG